jgi:hypothetical protein
MRSCIAGGSALRPDLVVVLLVALTQAAACGSRPAPATDEGRSILPDGPPTDIFTPRAIGNPVPSDERPQIANVQIADLDRDGLPDVLVCDVIRNQVIWLRQDPAGEFAEHALGTSIPAPAHVEPIDFDGDGDLDLVVASLGVLQPDNNRIGAVVVLENDGREQFTNRVIAREIARSPTRAPAIWTATATSTSSTATATRSTTRRPTAAPGTAPSGSRTVAA